MTLNSDSLGENTISPPSTCPKDTTSSVGYLHPKWSLLKEDGINTAGGGLRSQSQAGNQPLRALNAALNPRTRSYYTSMLEVLRDSGVPFMVGGAYSTMAYTGIERHTKDLDLFCKREDFDSIMMLLKSCGCIGQMIFPHWLDKAFNGDDFIDIIFNSGNGKSIVDDSWFQDAPECEVLGIPGIKLVRPEEIIWSKAFICERERYDGADVAHLIRVQGPKMDWKRLLERFSDGHDWRVLFSHITLFGYIYPDANVDGECIPDWVYDYFMEKSVQERNDLKLLREQKKRATEESTTNGSSIQYSAGNAPLIEKIERKICCGPSLSREQYLVDVSRWGYRDARSSEMGGPMGPSDIALWTAAIDSSSR